MNPLLSRDVPIPFDKIEAGHIVPGLRQALTEAGAELNALATASGPRSYDNTIRWLDDLSERLGRVFGIARHLTTVATTPEVREAFNSVLPEVSAFFARLPNNEGLWMAVKAFDATPEAAALTGVPERHLEKTMREFRRAGADLPADDKAQVEAIKIELAQLQTKFSENVLDATNDFELILSDEEELAGLPESAVRQARTSAEAKGSAGYRFTLQAPSILPFLKSSERRELRETFYRAFVDRAAFGSYDNRPLIGRILTLRRQLASLLGYDTFADFVLEPRMAGTGARASEFERELRDRSEPYFRAEVTELERFARESLELERLEPWDVAFASEHLRKARYDLDDEALRPYFALPNVLDGLFEISRRLFGVVVRERQTDAVWHADVTFYDLFDADGTSLGSFYTDWHPREDKRGGAWMNPMVTGGPGEESFAPHLAVVTGNLTPPQDGTVALLTHREVETVFHEFGHLLHHLLSKVEVRARGGTSVAWDFVELPSQIMENWTWEREALDLFALHVDSGEAIPDDLFERMVQARTFQGAMAQMRQLSMGTVDLLLHTEFDPEVGDDPILFGQRVMEAFSVRPEFAHNNFLASFSHIFAGGYAAGYYSYKWSEMLDADAFTRFRDDGIFNPATGRAFVAAILSRGDGDEPDALFHAFMGRHPKVDALIERTLGRNAVAAGD